MQENNSAMDELNKQQNYSYHPLPCSDSNVDQINNEHNISAEEDCHKNKVYHLNKYALAGAILASTNSILLGYDIGVMSGAVIYIRKDLKISSVQVEILVGCLNVCSLIGSLVSGKISDMIGRRYTIMIAALTFLIGALLMGLAPSFTFLMFGRVIAGIGVGFSLMISPVYVAELSPDLTRGFLTSLPEVFISFGILLGYVSNYALSSLPIGLNWRIMLGIAALPAILVALGVLAMPESPRWLVMKGKLEEAKQVLIRTSSNKGEAEFRLSEISQAATISSTSSRHGQGVWKELLITPTRPVLRILIAAVGINFFMQASGNDAVIYYSPEVFREAGVKGHLSRAFLSWCNAFLPRRLPSSPPHASIPSKHLPRAFLSRSNAFLPRRLPSSPPSSPDGSQSGGSLSPPLLPHAPSRGELLQLSSSRIAFSYEVLERATDGFSDANYLGKGGFGSVHKGILSNGKEVAVKQLKADSRQGEREFQAEVGIISRVHHTHLVSLVGYCSTGSQRLLAYEFVPNNTLEFHLHGQGRPTMDWSTRRRIALGSAKGLAYLHEDCHPRIIHRDIKAANILLDSKFEAKVADFGLAKDSTDSSTHVYTQVKGTFGYLDPEYVRTEQLTDKSDVYSYGVVLLELITGRLPIDEANPDKYVNLVEWARPFFMRALKGKNDLVDPRLKKQFDRNEMTCMVACAAACTRQSAKDRPKMSQARPFFKRGLKENKHKHLVGSRLKVFHCNEMTRMIACAEACTRLSANDRPTMSTVVRVLEGAVSIKTLKAGVTRGHSRGYSRDYNSQQHKEEDMTKLKKIASVFKGKWK